MKKSSVVLACLMLSVSCSKIKQFEDRTTSMDETTKAMSGTTNDMKSITGIMYAQIRSKESHATRNEMFSVLHDKEEGMGTRMAAAAVFFKSLEFQLWTADPTVDSFEDREDMFLDAANEFTRRINDIYEKVKLKKMTPTKTDSKKKHRVAEANFYALAGTMHFNHSFQEKLARRNRSVKLTSFYDIVKKSLIKDKNGEALEAYEEVLMNGLNKEILIELIKARVDILSALALKNLTDKREMTISEKFKGALFLLSGGKAGVIDLPETYQTINEATKGKTEEYLSGAIKAKNFLIEIGVTKHLEKTLESAFANIDLGGDGEIVLDKDAHKAKIKSMISELL